MAAVGMLYMMFDVACCFFDCAHIIAHSAKMINMHSAAALL